MFYLNFVENFYKRINSRLNSLAKKQSQIFQILHLQVTINRLATNLQVKDGIR